MITGFDWCQLYNDTIVDFGNPSLSKLEPVFTIGGTGTSRNSDVVDLTSLLISHDIATITDQFGQYTWNITFKNVFLFTSDKNRNSIIRWFDNFGLKRDKTYTNSTKL